MSYLGSWISVTQRFTSFSIYRSVTYIFVFQGFCHFMYLEGEYHRLKSFLDIKLWRRPGVIRDPLGTCSSFLFFTQVFIASKDRFHNRKPQSSHFSLCCRVEVSYFFKRVYMGSMSLSTIFQTYHERVWL